MAGTWKTVRVFISSTFRDMQAERDWLVRFVFPRLREELLKFRIHFEDVDLRWGVTSDQDAFDLCMDEIDNCHPRFICILGGRFGWVPPPTLIPAGFLDRVLAGTSVVGSLIPGERDALRSLYRQVNGERTYRLKEKPQTNLEVAAFNARGEIAVDVLQRAGLDGAQQSITASEIQYGALDKLQKPAFRFFYFRDDLATNAIPEPDAKNYRELAGSPAASFLEAIKARIKDPATRGRVLVAPGREEVHPLPWREYPCEWDAATSRIIKLREFGELVYSDLLASVTAQFGVAPEHAESHTDEEKFAEENAAMEAFVEEHSKRFVCGSRDTVLNELLAHASGTGDNGYVCLTGAPGSGKSALLSHLSQHATINNQPSTLLIRHFVGASHGSTDMRRTLQRLCYELKAGCPYITAEVPDDPEKLHDAISDFLRQASNRIRVVILLDAVNQFDPTSHSANLRWLPEELPANVRVILSVLDGPVLEELRRRSDKPREIGLQPLTTVDGEAIIEQFRKRYRKTLSDTQRTALLSKSDAGTPLYLLAALEELRTLGTYEEITSRIAELPPTTHELFAWILERLENDDGFRDASGRRLGRELVSRFAALLGASRYGLSRRELADLLDAGDQQGNVASLLHLLRPYLMRRGELLDFYHGQFRTAADELWLKTDVQRQAAHAQLAGYFQDQADPEKNHSWKGESPRGLAELPFHLISGRLALELESTLCELRFIEAKCKAGMSYDLVDDVQAAIESSVLTRDKKDILQEFDKFIRAQRHVLALYPELTIQLAADPSSSPSLRRRAIDLLQVGGYPWMSDVLESSDVPWRARFPGTKGVCLPDNRHILSNADDDKLSLFELSTGRPTLCIAKQARRIADFRICCDGRRVATRSTSGSNTTVAIWDFQTALQVAEFSLTGMEVRSYALSPSGMRIVISTFQGTLIMCDSQGTVKWIKRLDQWGVSPVALVCEFSTNGLMIACAVGKSVVLFDSRDGEVIAVLENSDAVFSCNFSPDSNRLVATCHDCTVRVWDIATRAELMTFAGHEGSVTSSSFSPDGAVIATASWDHTARLWDAITGLELRKVATTSDKTTICGFSPDGSAVLLGSPDGYLILWDIGSNSGSIQPHKSPVSACAYSPSGIRFLTAAGTRNSGALILWDGSNGARLTDLAESDPYWPHVILGEIRDCAFSGDEEKILMSEYWGHLFVRDAITGSRSNSLPIKGTVATCRFSPDATLILAGGSLQEGQGVLTFLDQAATEPIRTVLAHSAIVLSCCFSPDGRSVLSASADGTLRLWNTTTGDQLANFAGHSGAVNSCDFSPDGRCCVSGSSDKSVILWEIASSSPICRFDHHDAVVCCGFSPDNTRVASISQDGLLCIWDSKSEVLECKYWLGAKAVAAWRPDGRALAVGDASGRVRLLQLENMPFHPPTATAWSLGETGSPTRVGIGCVFCRSWFEVDSLQMPHSLECPHCRGRLMLNEFVIYSDWTKVAKKWRELVGLKAKRDSDSRAHGMSARTMPTAH